jgi:hypothetical protein
MTTRTLTSEDLRQHVLGLCERHEISVFWCKRPSQARSVRKAGEITIAPITTRLRYAKALHEIGHLLGRHQTSRHVMVREGWAWRWAQSNALVWTPAMQRDAEKALAWYAPRAAKIDSKWRPPTEEVICEAS